MRAISRNLIVDADVAFSAGESEAPVSSRCRSLLKMMLENEKYRAVFCPVLSAEWDVRGSSFSVRWRASMRARRRVIKLTDADIVKDKLERTNLQYKKKKAAEKDSHLINAAINASAPVASRDEKARGAFKLASNDIGEIKNVIWFNPVECYDFISRYIEGGEELPEDYLLRDGC